MIVNISMDDKFWYIFPIKESFMAWAAIRAFISGITASCFIEPMISTIFILQRWWSPAYIPQAITFCVLPWIFIVDIIFQLIFIVGTRKPSLRLWKNYYQYCQMLWVMTPMFILYAIFIFKGLFDVTIGHEDQTMLVIATAILLFICQIFQSYVMLVLKNEIKKIKYARILNEMIRKDITLKIVTKSEMRKYVYNDEGNDDIDDHDEICNCHRPSRSLRECA